MLDPADTIAAIASPPGGAVRGIVRLSGPRAWQVALGPFRPPMSRPPRRPTLAEGRWWLESIDRDLPATVALWPAPRTYTGQELAEIHTVGAVPLLQRVLADCLARGARLAEPGEFTLRAFLHGRLDLTRAEAVLGVIEAQSDAQLDAALSQLAGGLAGPIGSLRGRLLDVLAHLEAGLDFVDERDVDPIARSTLAAELDAAADRVEGLAQRFETRDRPDGSPRVVLVGPPNAGKSRLFNRLAGSDLAMVSPVSGTTRDYVSGLCDCGGRRIELIDTAGEESTSDAIGSMAQTLRRQQAESADLLLVCGPAEPAGRPPPARVDRPHLRVGTKADLAPVREGWLPTSAATGEGIEALKAAIAAALDRDARAGQALPATGARCAAGLARAASGLRRASVTLGLGGGDELVAIDLRDAIEDLGRVVGAEVNDDVLDRIFGRFCIGK